jgi:hypothetical protein
MRGTDATTLAGAAGEKHALSAHELGVARVAPHARHWNGHCRRGNSPCTRARGPAALAGCGRGGCCGLGDALLGLGLDVGLCLDLDLLLALLAFGALRGGGGSARTGDGDNAAEQGREARDDVCVCGKAKLASEWTASATSADTRVGTSPPAIGAFSGRPSARGRSSSSLSLSLVCARRRRRRLSCRRARGAS